MGCDIHLVVEFKRRKEREVTEELKGFKNKDGSPKTITYKLDSKWKVGHTVRNCWNDRVYGMFAALNNVRNYWEDKITPLPDRGLPEDVSEDTLKHYCHKVVTDEEYEKNKKRYWNSDYNYCCKSDASKWIEKGYSKQYIINGTEYVSGPDWHSPNWCTTQEMEECYSKVFKDKWGGEYIEWAALLGAMKGYEASGEYMCRAVFWFDN